MEHASTFPIGEVALAIETAGIAGNGELHLLLAGLGDVEADEGAEGPVGLVRGIIAMLMVDQRESDLAGLVGAVNRPAAAEGFRGARDEAEEQCADNKSLCDDSVTAIHDFPPGWLTTFRRRGRRCFSGRSICRE